jgi:cytochrome c-type biogenesis protein
MTALLLALAAGVLTVAAPCILPMLPILLGASVGQTSRARPIFITLGFVLSFAAVALLFGAFAASLGESQDVLRKAAIILLLLFGILMIFPLPFQLLTARMNFLINRADEVGRNAGRGNWGGFVLGATLGVVWTPCAGPVLGSILTIVATSHRLAWSGLLLLIYAIGAGIPMLGIAYGGQYVTTRVRRFARYSHRLQQGFGVVVILIAIGFYYQYDTVVTAWLTQFYPNANVGL